MYEVVNGYRTSIIGCCIENQSLLFKLKMIMLTVKILFQKDSTEGFSKEAQEKIMGATKGTDSDQKSSI